MTPQSLAASGVIVNFEAQEVSMTWVNGIPLHEPNIQLNHMEGLQWWISQSAAVSPLTES